MNIKCSVVIPCKDRFQLLERAVESVIKNDKSGIVEVIIVDDGSTIPLKNIKLMRMQDRIIRLNKNMGGAVARNTGIKAAKGELIYLLDSDDYFIDMNFENDIKTAKNGYIYYTDIKIGKKISCFPDSITYSDYFNFIFKKHVGIAQTSSLMFRKDNNIYFDESLPKHQDWDLLLFSCLLKGISPVKKEGLIYLDRQDKFSISRVYAPYKSDPWLRKLSKSNLLSNNDFQYVSLMCKYHVDNIGYVDFLKLITKLLFTRKVTVMKVLVIFYKRLFFKMVAV
ncbi:glycosyltransferase family 2 protein [Acinetobacter schindleri]|uniref:glycosyltransferase family 2 protein n=1 Tax=Acinetobacter schindleri TaxID=108981 RepID=UPI003F551A6F